MLPAGDLSRGLDVNNENTTEKASRDFQPTASSGFVEDGPHDNDSALTGYGCVSIKLYLQK